MFQIVLSTKFEVHLTALLLMVTIRQAKKYEYVYEYIYVCVYINKSLECHTLYLILLLLYNLMQCIL